jgi:hypothetical protein
MRRPPTLPKLQNLILEQLVKVRFATNRQLASMCGAQAPNTSNALKGLLNIGLIDGFLHSRPMILYLTPAGCRLMGAPMPPGRHHASWSIMAHACHRNAAAEDLAARHPGFYFLSRPTLLKQGFNPGHGEHAAIDGAGKTWFVLLDDCLMGSDRIKRSWTRRHVPSKKYWPDATGRKMCEVAQGFLVVSTDEDNAERHRARILKDGLPADVLTLKALWKT